MLKLPATAAWLHDPGSHLAPNRIAAIRAFSHVTQPHLARVRVGFRAVQVPELLLLSLSFALCHTSTRQPYCRCDGSCGPPKSPRPFPRPSERARPSRDRVATCSSCPPAPLPKHTLARTLSHPMSPPTSDVSTSKGPNVPLPEAGAW